MISRSNLPFNKERPYKRQPQIPLIGQGLGPFFGSLVVLEIMPGEPAAVVLHSPSCFVGLFIDSWPLSNLLVAVGLGDTPLRSVQKRLAIAVRGNGSVGVIASARDHDGVGIRLTSGCASVRDRDRKGRKTSWCRRPGGIKPFRRHSIRQLRAFVSSPFPVDNSGWWRDSRPPMLHMSMKTRHSILPGARQPACNWPIRSPWRGPLIAYLRLPLGHPDL